MSIDESSGGGERLLTTAEAAELLRVDARTVTRWVKSGKLTSIRISGGGRRYRESEVRAFLGQAPAPDAGPPPGPGDPDLDL